MKGGRYDNPAMIQDNSIEAGEFIMKLVVLLLFWGDFGMILWEADFDCIHEFGHACVGGSISMNHFPCGR